MKFAVIGMIEVPDSSEGTDTDSLESTLVESVLDELDLEEDEVTIRVVTSSALTIGKMNEIVTKVAD